MSWLTCNKTVDATWNDLALYQHLWAYRTVNAIIAATVSKVLEQHLWYMTSEMLPLAPFSTKVPDE